MAIYGRGVKHGKVVQITNKMVHGQDTLMYGKFKRVAGSTANPVHEILEKGDKKRSRAEFYDV